VETSLSGQLLLARLTSEFPQSNPRLVKFNSGSYLIDLQVRGKAYLIEYVVGQGYGLSKQSGSGYGTQGADEAFENLSELERSVRKLMTTPS
jgi:hypothetical protein